MKIIMKGHELKDVDLLSHYYFLNRGMPSAWMGRYDRNTTASYKIETAPALHFCRNITFAESDVTADPI